MTRAQHVRGLATVALLKAHFDKGLDYIGMFYPFVADAVKSFSTDGFTTETARAQLAEVYGISLPQDLVRMLLKRGVRQKHFRREGGRFFRGEDFDQLPEIREARTSIEEEHRKIGSGLVGFAMERGLSIPDEETALELLSSFLAENHIAVLLAGPEESNELGKDLARDRIGRVVARFVEGCLDQDSQWHAAMRRLLEGCVLQSTLLLRDIATAKRRFRQLTVYMDTQCILALIGLEGEIRRTASREGFSLLRTTGAKVAAFEATVEEIRRILSLIEHRIATKEGRESLWPTALVRHLLTNQYSPSDVRQASALIRENLRSLGLTVREFPPRQTTLTLDERALTQKLRRPCETETEPRVVHDVDAIAAIVTFRRGLRPTSMDDARAVFCTTNSRLVRTVQEWYSEQEVPGILPIAHQVRLTNLAWLKKPAAAGQLKLHELAALCSAALQPSEDTWKKFLQYLQELEQQGELTSEEAVAVLVSSFTDRYLGELEDRQEDIDAASVSEVVERVKQRYRGEGDEKVAEVEASLAEASSQVAKSHEERRQLELRIEGRARWVAEKVAGFLFGLAAAIIILSIALSVPGALGRLGPAVKVAGWIGVLILAVLTALNLIKGWMLVGTRERLAVWLQSRIRGWLVGD